MTSASESSDPELVVMEVQRCNLNKSVLYNKTFRNPLSPGDVAPQDIHNDRLRDVIRVMARHYLVDPQLHGAPVQGLAPEHAAEGAVVLEPDLGHNLVHGPAIEILIGENFERDSILVSVSLHRFQ